MNSTNVTFTYNVQTVIQQCSYIVVGFSAFITNCLILLAILIRKNPLEHFFYFVGALAIGDIIHGLGYLFAGARRLSLILSGSDKSLITMWDCAVAFPTLFFTYGREASIVMTLFISLDRLIALSNIKFYLNLSKRYAVLMIFFGYLCVSISVFILCYTSYVTGRNVLVTVMCYVDFTPTMSIYESFFVISLGFLSSLLMIVSLIVVWFQRSSSIPQIQQVQVKRQYKLTVTIALIVSLTILLWTVPNLLAHIYKTNGGPLYTLLSPYMWCLTNFSSTVNALILIFINSEIKKSLLNFFFKSQTVVSTVNPRT